METRLESFVARQAELIDSFYRFVGPEVQVEDNLPMNLAIWQDPVGSKKYVARFRAGTGDGLQKQLTAVSEFMQERKFVSVEENYREDIYVNSDGAVANLNLSEVPGASMELTLSLQIPKTQEESELVKAYYNVK